MWNLKELRPFVRYAQRVEISDRTSLRGVIAYDHRLFYVKSGTGTVTVDGEIYRAQSGDLFIFSAGVPYSLTSEAGGLMELIGISFDLGFDHCEKKTPIPPVRYEGFDPSGVVEGGLFPRFSPIIQRARRDAEGELLGIYADYAGKLLLYEHKISGRLLALLVGAEQKERCETTQRGGARIERILEVIRTNYKEPLDNLEVGRLTGYHKNHVNRLIVAYTGVSLHKYLQSFRIERAMELLESGELSVSEVASAVGFVDPTHFTKRFKIFTGLTPSEYRKGR